MSGQRADFANLQFHGTQFAAWHSPVWVHVDEIPSAQSLDDDWLGSQRVFLIRVCLRVVETRLSLADSVLLPRSFDPKMNKKRKERRL